MKKTVQWIAAVLALGVFAVASAGSEPAAAPAARPAPVVQTAMPGSDEPVAQSIGHGVETETIYYSDATKTVIVGSCLQRTCVPKGKTCTGIVTIHRDIFQGPC